MNSRMKKQSCCCCCCLTPPPMTNQIRSCSDHQKLSPFSKKKIERIIQLKIKHHPTPKKEKKSHISITTQNHKQTGHQGRSSRAAASHHPGWKVNPGAAEHQKKKKKGNPFSAINPTPRRKRKRRRKKGMGDILLQGGAGYN